MHISYWKEVKSNNIGRIGLGLLALIVIAAVFLPLLVPWSPLEQTKAAFCPPSKDHWLGTNDVGQDVLAQLLVGARGSLLVGITAALLTTMFSGIAGSSAGLLGGAYEKVLLRVIDALLVIPPMFIYIIAAAYLRPGAMNLILLLSLFGWPAGARVVRAQTLTLKEKAHVRAAQTFGGNWFYLVTRHLLPDMAPVLTAQFILALRRAVFMEAGLSFLGITDPATISWGKMLYQALKYIYLDAWQWWLVPVGIALSVTVTAFSFLGYALEETFDPRLRRGRYAGN